MLQGGAQGPVLSLGVVKQIERVVLAALIGGEHKAEV